jgi:hypothetical protein
MVYPPCACVVFTLKPLCIKGLIIDLQSRNQLGVKILDPLLKIDTCGQQGRIGLLY